MTADEMRAALMAALADVPELDAEFVTDRILPTVRMIVAGELRAVADELAYAPPAKARWLRDRATALDPTS